MRTAARPAAPSALRADERGLNSRALLERYVGTLADSLAEPAATQASYDAWREYDRLTWPEWLLQRGASPEAVRLMTLGGDSSALSALYMLRQFAMLRTSSQLFKIAGGMDRLPQAMAAALGDVVRYQSRGRQNLARGRVAVDRVRNGRPRRADRGGPRRPHRPAVRRCGRSSSARGCRRRRRRPSPPRRIIPASGFCCSRATASGIAPA